MDDERVRLEGIVLKQQEQLKALEAKLDRMTAEYAERGKINARLNKENVQLRRAASCG